MYKIAIAGASGMIGQALVSHLKLLGCEVVPLVRKKQEEGIYWDPQADILSTDQLEGFDAVINLSGENISSGRWTEKKKRKILESRVRTTALLSQAIAGLKSPPKVLINASAVGYYGNRGDELIDEATPPGADFLADVCQQWEAALQPAAQKGVRVVILRFGVVLSPTGGALAKMLLPFKLGLGGNMGSGTQYMSWIAIDDLVQIFSFCLEHEELSGPFNAVAPSPVTNAEFTRQLATRLKRPAFFAIPAWGARIVFGKMADALLLSSARVKPVRLLKAGFCFRYPDLGLLLASYSL